MEKGLADAGPFLRRFRSVRAMVGRIGALPGAEIVTPTTINQAPDGISRSPPGTAKADHDRRTDETIARIVANGKAFFGGTTWRGKRRMRVSVCDSQTSEVDVDRAVGGRWSQ